MPWYTWSVSAAAGSVLPSFMTSLQPSPYPAHRASPGVKKMLYVFSKFRAQYQYQAGTPEPGRNPHRESVHVWLPFSMGRT